VIEGGLRAALFVSAPAMLDSAPPLSQNRVLKLAKTAA
jgi:hypothetical protein